VTIEPARTARGTTARRKVADHTPEERALLAFLDRYFPDRRRREVGHARERREDLLAA